MALKKAAPPPDKYFPFKAVLLGLKLHTPDKADEMIQAIDIEPAKSHSQAFNPPAIVLRLHRLPVIHRQTQSCPVLEK